MPERIRVKVLIGGEWVITWGEKRPKGKLSAYDYTDWCWRLFKKGQWRRLVSKVCR